MPKHKLLPQFVRAISTLLLVLTLSLTVFTGTPAVTQAASSDLTQPLNQLNQCGSGEGTTFTLAAVGDILLHMYIQNIAEQRGYDYLFDQVRPFLTAADLTYANFEGNANPSAPRSEYPQFNYNPTLAGALKKAGVDVVSTANNHAIDTGPAGVDATLDTLDQAGLLHHGTTRRNQTRQAYLPLTFTANNGETVKAAFLSYTFSTNGIPDPYGQVNMLWNGRGQVAQPVLDAIRKAKQETDLVIVAVHWGEEYQLSPNAQQRQGAQTLADAGADIILGDHPHTLQPAEWLESNGRQSLVIYSLGNFVAAQQAFQAQSFTQTSLIYYVGFTKLPNGKVVVNGYRYLPVYIEYDLRPVPLLPSSDPTAYRHVLDEMRDPNGAHVISPVAGKSGPQGIKVCNSGSFRETGQVIAGDFYDYFYTLGSNASRVELPVAVAIVGYPIAPVVEELAGDCTHTTRVLYTERQRLELQPEANWPFRVVGTQLGTEVYKIKYGVQNVERRTNIGGGAIANERFRTFYQRYGGLTVFGYPISGLLQETDRDTGKTKMVQYFERARFEYTPGEPENANPLYKVQLGLLGREYPGIAAQCSSAKSALPFPGEHVMAN
ncbi:MAG TPA: CapA family protein [Chloroflexia bacterium]|nr:CapA family protein [Chloroflexia bacterium]